MVYCICIIHFQCFFNVISFITSHSFFPPQNIALILQELVYSVNLCWMSQKKFMYCECKRESTWFRSLQVKYYYYYCKYQQLQLRDRLFFIDRQLPERRPTRKPLYKPGSADCTVGVGISGWLTILYDEQYMVHHKINIMLQQFCDCKMIME